MATVGRVSDYTLRLTEGELLTIIGILGYIAQYGPAYDLLGELQDGLGEIDPDLFDELPEFDGVLVPRGKLPKRDDIPEAWIDGSVY